MSSLRSVCGVVWCGCLSGRGAAVGWSGITDGIGSTTITTTTTDQQHPTNNHSTRQKIFFAVYELAIDTVLLSFCEDSESNGGHPRFAPQLLLDAIGDGGRAAGADGERRGGKGRRGGGGGVGPIVG